MRAGVEVFFFLNSNIYSPPLFCECFTCVLTAIILHGRGHCTDLGGHLCLLFFGTRRAPKGGTRVPAFVFSSRLDVLLCYIHRSQTQVYLAASPTLKEEAEQGAAVGGTYFSDCRPKKTTKEAEDLALAGELWKLSEKLTGSSFSV